MKSSSLLLCISLPAVLCSLSACRDNDRQEWQLVWEENFDAPQIDENVWARVPRGTSDWNDMMSLREDLAYIEDGQLVLLGKVGEEQDETPFVTGGVTSRGKKSFREARVEIRARFNSAKGFWPALWLMPDMNLPAPEYAEVDLMEHLNHEDSVYQTVHSRYTLDGGDLPPKYALAPIDKEGWNIYAAEIHRDSLCLFTNGVKTLTYPRVEGAGHQFPWPDYPFFLILSNQLGGSWVGPVDAPQELPSKLCIDWIKVYEKPVRKLLNGKDLAGWKEVLREGEAVEEPTFVADGDILHISGRPFGYIRTEERFSDYTLHLEWRWAGGAAVDGGIFHFLQGEDKVWPTGVQFQMTPQDMGVLMGGIPIEGIEGPFYRKPRLVEESPEKPVGEWNSMDFVCRDGVIKAFLNGVFVNEARCEAREGYIGFQSEGGALDIRNLWVR